MKLDPDRIKAAIESAPTPLGFKDIPIRHDDRWQLGSPSDGSASDFIARYLIPTDRILDLGCGRGHVLMGIHSSFYYGLGIDNDPRQIQMAEEAKRQQAIQNVDFLLLDFSREAERLQPHRSTC